MLIINNINLPLDTDFNNLKVYIEKLIGYKTDNVTLYRKSVDARHKSDVHFCCSVLVESNCENQILKRNKNAALYAEREYVWKKCENRPVHRPVVAGFGPAGMFCALTLAYAGLKPIVLERGGSIDERIAAVNSFFAGGKLNTECNVQFGEGGAGTFSDGKLTTGIKNYRCRTVIKTFCEMGASPDILTDAKPHIGTDVLTCVVKNIRKKIISLGGEICFNTKLESISLSGGKLISVTANRREILCDCLVVAIGHSARDTYQMLLDCGADMVQKPFAVGVRIEHLQENINKALYGQFYNHSKLKPAEYKLAHHLENGRGVYTFCMCPGGEVINASSNSCGLAVNGMSNFARNSKNANSAVLVGVDTSDFPDKDALAGCELQERIEKAAYSLCNGRVPVNTVGNFVYGKEFKIGSVKPTVKPQFEFADFSLIFPDFICESLKEGIKEFGKKIKGFDTCDAILTAPETRSSAPVRILRDCEMQSNLRGVYPCGEGAGYAGGIVSAAVDGMLTAEKIIEHLNID